MSPYPQLLGDLVRIAIVSSRIAATASTADFNGGAAAIGTGPYRVAAWVPGDRLHLVRNAGYWGSPPPWEEVTFRPMANDAARLAALLSGSADVIDKVPVNDVPRLRSDGRVNIVVHDGDRSMFLVPALADARGSYVSDNDGNRLTPSPLLQVPVRQAISLAINRRALLDRVMEGLGSVANQVVPPGMFGYSDRIPPAAYDPGQARRLLADAGYPHGFRMTLHCSNGRYVNDRETCQVVAQMMARIGIQSEVEAEPQSVFYARLTRTDFGLALNGWGSDTGDSIVVLRQALHSVDPSRGLGGFNRGHYASKEVDRLIETATGTTDPGQRDLLQQQAMEQAMAAAVVIPLVTSAWIWGTRKGLAYQGSFEEGTLAMRVLRE